MPYSYPSLPQYVHTLAVTTIHRRYTYCTPASAITRTAPFISTALHLAKYTSVDVNALSKSQMMGLILWWRPTVTTLLMAFLSILKCLHKIGQSSSYHRATIWVSVLCPLPSLRSVTSEDSCNIPNWFHMALQGIYSCQHHCVVVWNDTIDLLKCYIYLYYWYHLGTSHLSGQHYYPHIMVYVNHYKWAPATRSIHK